MYMKNKKLDYIFTLYVIVMMCIFFALVGASDSIKHHKVTIDYLTLFSIMTSAFFGMGLYENDPKKTGFWGLISAFLTGIIFYKLHVYTLTILYLYNSVASVILFIYGKNHQRKLDKRNTTIELIVVTIIGFLIQIYFEWIPKNFHYKSNFEFWMQITTTISFLLGGIGQSLLRKQTIWQFSIWIPKNIIGLATGILSMNAVVICRNIFFFGLNIFTTINWINEKENQN